MESIETNNYSTSLIVIVRRYNPFNSQRPANPSFFVGREDELKRFDIALSQTMHGSPMNMCITGNRGIGKTSLLRKMESLSHESDCLIFSLTNYDGTMKEIPELINNIIIGIKHSMSNNKPFGDKRWKIAEWLKSLRPTFSYMDVSVEISYEERRFAAQGILKNTLLELWEKASKDYSAIILMIDEAESFENIDGSFRFLREVFQGLSHDAKYMLILSGKLNFQDKLSEAFSPLCRFMPTFELDNFTLEETIDFITKTLASVEVTVDENTIVNIFEKSQGHPFIVVKICEMIFNELSEDENQILNQHYERGINVAIDDINRHFFHPMFHPLSPKAKKILVTLTDLNKKSFSFSEAQKVSKIPKNSLSPYLSECVKKGCLNKPKRARYEIFHHLFIEFLKDKKDEVLMSS